MFSSKVVASSYVIAISLTLCLSVHLSDKCTRTRKLEVCSNITPNDPGLIDSENILIVNSAVSIDKAFLQKFPNVVVMKLYRVNLTFDLTGDDESSLRKLSIDNSELSLGISDGLSNLEVFSLRNTAIGNGGKLLENLTNLNRLIISNSSISQISLRNNKKLTWLDLSYNNLDTVPDDIPDGISYLDLSGNSIERVQKESFEDLQYLEILLMENNKIKNISKDAFDELHSLRRLFLSNNSLTSADFLENLQLKFLDLSFNQILKVDDVLTCSTRLILEKEVLYEKPKTASYISLALVIVFCGLVLIFIFYCGK